MKKNIIGNMKVAAFIAAMFCCASAYPQAFSSGGGSAAGYKSTLGNNNTATGNYSLAAGWGNQATGQTSFALGYYSKATGLNSLALGMYASSQANYGITIGRGLSSTKPLTNTTSGIMLGMYSNVPTLYISPSSGENRTGKVGIGNVTDPQAKLHIKGDAMENADILLASTGTNKSIIQFRTDDNNITVGSDNVMRINALKTYLRIDAPKVCLGSTTTFLSNTNNEVFSIKAPNEIAQVAKTINLTAGRDIQLSGTDEIGIQSESIALTGKVGINTANTTNGYALAVDGGLLSMGRFKVNSEETIEITAKEGAHYKPILLRGNVGINTDRVANGYVLSVNGGVIAEKVMIKYHTEWPDYVFESGYNLMPMHDLRTFVTQNKHLPEVPSAAEIENGLDVGQLQGILLKKIEELTLYTLQLQEQVERQQAEIEELKGKIK